MSSKHSSSSMPPTKRPSTSVEDARQLWSGLFGTEPDAVDELVLESVIEILTHYVDYGKANYGDSWYHDPYRKQSVPVSIRKFSERLMKSTFGKDDRGESKQRSDSLDLAIYAIYNVINHHEQLDRD